MLSIVLKELFTNNNQKKQLATILTTLASIIVSAIIAGVVKSEIQFGILVIVAFLIIPVPLYFAAISVLKKESTDARKCNK